MGHPGGMVALIPFVKAREVVRRRLGRRPAISQARVTTDRAERYGKQLCSHLGRKAEGRWNESGTDSGTGTIRFDADSEVRLRAEPESLLLTLTCPLHRRDELRDVVGRHLERFGARETLTVTWTDPSKDTTC